MIIDFEDKNLAVLKKYYPELAKLCRSGKTSGVRVASAEPLPRQTLPCRAEGVLIHSERDPVREADRLARRSLAGAPKDGAVFLLGFGFGYAAEAVLALEPNAVLVIVEKRLSVFKTALKNRDLSALFDGSRHIFVIGGQPEGILAALEIVKTVRVILRNTALIALDAQWFSDIERNISTWREKNAINAATLAKFGKLWTRNTKKNLWALRDFPGITSLTGAFNFPILLVAAGPSLDELRGEMSMLRERFAVVAVDTALRFLLAAGVDCAPDFVISADPQYWNLRHLDPLAKHSRENGAANGGGAGKICFITEISVQSAALRLPVRTLLSSPLYPPGPAVEAACAAGITAGAAALGKKGRLAAGGSVATSALDFALKIRAAARQPVYIAGLDLAFPKGKTHFKGALFEELILSGQNRLKPAQTASFAALQSAAPFWTKAFDGGFVRTDKRLSLYRRWFENRLKMPDAALVFSLGKSGAAICGMNTTSAMEALALPPCRVKIEERKKEIFYALDSGWNAGAAARSKCFERALKCALG